MNFTPAQERELRDRILGAFAAMASAPFRPATLEEERDRVLAAVLGDQQTRAALVVCADTQRMKDWLNDPVNHAERFDAVVFAADSVIRWSGARYEVYFA